MNTKTAVITGASSGMGKALAFHLAKKGYSLLLIARNETKLREVERKLQGDHRIAAIDVANSAKVNQAIETFLSEFNQIDLLFNSAGYVKRGTTTLDENELLQMMNTNFLGTFNFIKAVTPHMSNRKCGHIVSVASYSGKYARAPLGGYAASKFAVVGFCESVYKELAPLGVAVTTICPNLVDTEMTADVNMPREQMLHTDDIVKTVDYILSLSPSVAIKEIVLQCKIRIIQHEMY